MSKNILLLFIWILLPFFLSAQFLIKGKVLDNEGKPLAGATVNLDNGKNIKSTNYEGEFIFEKVAKGEHVITITYIGFKTETKTISIYENIDLDFKLTPETYFSDEVIIMAIRATDDEPTTHTNIDKTTIAKENLGKDLPFLVKQTPSVVVTSDAGAGVGYTGLRIRGTDLSGINVTLNGVPVNDPESHEVYFVDMPDLASSIENMQIQRGVGTSTNGAAAFGASINIKTEGFSDEPFAEYALAGGSFNTWKNTFKVGSGIIKDKWNFEGRLSWIKSDGYIDRAYSNLKSVYLSGGYYGKKDIVKFISMLGVEETYQAWYGVPKDSLETNRTYNPAGAIYDYNGNFLGYYDNQTDNYNQNYYQLHYAHKFSNYLNITSAVFFTKGKGYYESYKNNQSFSDYGMNDIIIGNDTITKTNLIRQKWLDNNFYGLNIAVNYEKNKFSLNIGTGWNRYIGDHYGKVIWSQISSLDDFNKDWYFNTGIKNEFNIFAKGQYTIINNLNLFVDLQYRNIQYNTDGIDDELNDFIVNKKYNFFNPKFGIYYQINKYNSTFFSIGIANREPSRSDFRDADPGTDVKPERLTDYELGYKFRKKNFMMETDIYFMDYKNQLVLTGKINNVGTPIRTNVPKSYRTGIELIMSYNITKWLKWGINGSFSENKIKDFTAYIDDWNNWPEQKEEYLGNTDISFSPSFVGNNSFTLSPIDNFNIDIISNYVSRQYIDNTSNKERSIDPYFITNIKFHYSFSPRFMRGIDLILSLNNIFNTEYETNAWVYRYIYNNVEYDMNGYYPQAKFNFMTGITFKF
jgi:iron complex outermembrane receptor protein